MKQVLLPTWKLGVDQYLVVCSFLTLDISYVVFIVDKHSVSFY